MSRKPIELALAECTAELMSLPGVFGTARSLCQGQPCIVVYIEKEKDSLLQMIPESIEGYPVRVKVSGRFRALTPEK